MRDIIAEILEFFGMAYFQDFSNTMYDEGMYALPFILMIVIPALSLLFFYVLRDGVKGANIKNWLLYGIIAIILTFVFNFLYLNSKDTKYQLDFALGDMIAFLTVTVFYSTVVFVLGSLLFRFFSTDRKRVPYNF